MKNETTGNWSEYRRLVLSEMQRLASAVTALEADNKALRAQIAADKQALKNRIAHAIVCLDPSKLD